jgi:hypothetical protein
LIVVGYNGAVTRPPIGALWLAASTFAVAQTPYSQGRVIDAITGRPLAGVVVMLPNSPDKQATTNANGEFELIGDMWRASYQYRFAKAGYRYISHADVAGGHGSAAAALVEGADGTRPELYYAGGEKKFTPLTAMMIPISEVAGSVVDESGHPLANVNVSASPTSEPEVSEAPAAAAVTDAQGKFTLQVNAVETRLTASPPCAGSERRASLARIVQPTTGTFHVELVLPARPTYSVRGRIANHVPRFDGAILFLALSELCPEASTRVRVSGGGFSLDGVPPGKYVLTGTLQRDVGDCDTCSVEPSRQVRRAVEVVDRNLHDVDLTFYTGAEVRGVVHWEGTPREGVSLAMFDAAGEAGSFVSLNEKEGVPASRRVQPGQWRLGLTNPERYYLKEIRLNGAVLPGNSIAITPAMQRVKLDVYVSSIVAACELKVKDAAGRPLNLYTAALMRREGDRYVVVPFEGNPPGEYRIVALTPALAASGFRPAIMERFAGQGTPVKLRAGVNEVEVTAIEAHPLVR